ncbi:MAG: hypothetical protein ABI197_07050 [Granulicella sp.]
MTLPTPIAPKVGLPATSHSFGAGYLFGVPVGDLGWFGTLLVSFASGVAAFFASTFLGIVSLLIVDMTTHRTPDFTITYRLIGLPVGLLVLATALIYLGTLWVRRMLRRT